MFHDKDRGDGKEAAPEFYGALSEETLMRLASLALLTTFTMCHVFMRCLGLALLGVTFGAGLCFGIWFSDFILFILVKVARQDFFYWIPVESLPVAIFLNVVFRFGDKVMVDFCGNLQMRHP